MRSYIVVVDGRVSRGVYGDTHKWLLGSCVRFSQTAVACCNIHFETKKQWQKWEN